MADDIAENFGHLGLKQRTAIAWIAEHADREKVKIGRCRCRHKEEDRVVYAWTEGLPKKIEIKCAFKTHYWKDITLVPDLESIDDANPSYKTTMCLLRSTIQSWKIKQIVSESFPDLEPLPVNALETQLVRIPEDEMIHQTPESSHFVVTSRKHREPKQGYSRGFSMQIGLSTLAQLAVVALGFKLLGNPVKKAWREGNMARLIALMLPLIESLPGFGWLSTWLRAYAEDPSVLILLAEILKKTLSKDSEQLSERPQATGAARVVPSIAESSKYKAAKAAFRKRELDDELLGGHDEYEC